MSVEVLFGIHGGLQTWESTIVSHGAAELCGHNVSCEYEGEEVKTFDVM